MDKKFMVNISLEGYNDKKEVTQCLRSKTAKAIGRSPIAFAEKELNVPEFANLLKAGHAFCPLYIVENGQKYKTKFRGHINYQFSHYQKGGSKGGLKLSFKRDDFYKGTQVIFIDIDFTTYPTIQDYVAKLSIKPQIAYSSYSDKKTKNGVYSRRFHLIYVFSDMLDRNQFKANAIFLSNKIEKDTEEELEDRCGCSLSQYCNGMPVDGELYVFSDILYTSFIYNIVYEENNSNNTQEESHNISLIENIPNVSNVLPKYTTVSFAMKNAITEFTEEAIVEFKNTCNCRYFYDNSDDEKWINTIVTLGEKTIHCAYQFVDSSTYCSLCYNYTKIKDGHKRRKKLYQRALMRRWFRPNVTPNELFYNWVLDVWYDCELDDDLTTENAVKNVERVMSLTVTELQEKVKPIIAKAIKRRGNKMGVIFSFPRNLTNGERQTAKGQIHRQIVCSMYDVEKSLEENRLSLATNGIRLGPTTIYKYVGDLIDEQKKLFEAKIMTLYDPGLSINKNIKIMNELGLNITNKTLKKILERKVA